MRLHSIALARCAVFITGQSLIRTGLTKVGLPLTLGIPF